MAGLATVVMGAHSLENRYKMQPADELKRFMDEIQLEFDHPIQQVRDIIENPQTEEVCRAFLQAYVDHIRVVLQHT